MKFTDDDILKLKLTIQDQSEQIKILKQNSDLYHEIITSILKEINNVITKGNITGKIYKISSVELNNIKTLLTKIIK